MVQLSTTAVTIQTINVKTYLNNFKSTVWIVATISDGAAYRLFPSKQTVLVLKFPSWPEESMNFAVGEKTDTRAILQSVPSPLVFSSP